MPTTDVASDGGAATTALLAKAVLIDEDAAPAAYRAAPLRWLVLFTFSLVSAQQQIGWVLPGAVQPNYLSVYGFGEDTIQLLSNYGCIFFIVVAIPSAWALDRLGCRLPTLACVALMLACSVLRCLARDASTASVIFVHASMILDAIVGPVVMAAPGKLAEDWFGPRERTLATAIAALSNQCGSVVVYALVPLLCPDASAASLARLNYALLALSVANAALAAAYFPSHPPQGAPSASAGASARAEARASLRSLLTAWRALARVPPYVCIAIVYSLAIGSANPQGALLEPGLAALGASQALAGWVNAAAQLASLLLGVAASAAVDALKARARWLHKAALVGSMVAAGFCYLLYAVAYVRPGALAAGGAGGAVALPLACAAYIAANGCIGAAIPLLFDSAAEHAFGRAPEGGEGALIMGLVLPLNIVGMAVLFAPSSSFFAWINWAVAGVSLAGAAALAAAVPASLERFDFDMAAAGGGGGGVIAKLADEAGGGGLQ